MEKYVNVTWAFATMISWLSFGTASWFWANEYPDTGLGLLTILWFAISLVLFFIGYRLRNKQN